MRIEVVTGDLLAQDVDVIVNPWNQNFIPWWLLLPQGVSGQIKRKAGLEPFRQVRKAGFMRLGQAVLTSAGRLPHKGMIHVAGLNVFWRASRRSMILSSKNALQIAEAEGFGSMAIPLIGAGTGGLSTEASIESIQLGLSESGADVTVFIVVYKR